MALLGIPLNTPYQPTIIGPVMFPYDGLMVSRMPNPDSIRIDVLNSFTKPFDWISWTLFVLASSTFIGVLCIMTKIGENGEWRLYSNFGKWIRIILGEINFNKLLNRFNLFVVSFIISFFFIEMVHLNLFTTNLFVARPVKVINTFKDLLERDDVKLTLLKEGTSQNQFRDAKDGVFKEIWDKSIRTSENGTFISILNSTELVDCVDQIKNGRRVLIIPANGLQVFAEIGSNIYPKAVPYIAKEKMKPSIYMFAYSKNISKHLRDLLDSK